MQNTKNISIIIPLLNEEESLNELVTWVDEVMKRESYSYEILMIDDGSKDNSWSKILELSQQNNNIRGIQFRRNYGKSAALYHGFKQSQGSVVVTMDADLQDSPEEIPEMYKMIVEQDYDIVSGWKKDRKDNTFTKNIPSKLYNATARWVTGIKLHDMNCGLKAYKNEVVKSIEVYGEMHRYIPYLAKNEGYNKIGEKIVVHQKRKYGTSKFGLERFVNGMLDLLSLWFLSTFGKKPMHFFGFSGILMFLIGSGISIYLIIEKICLQSNNLNYRAVTDQPLFYIALFSAIVGVLFFLTGFICEMISRTSVERNHYNIKDTI